MRLGAAATALIHKLQKGIPPWVPLKGHENKTYKQLQDEAYENKRRDLAVLEANNGVWPGVRTPSHALFLWAGGSELTSLLEEDHMPNKFIPKDVRYSPHLSLMVFVLDLLFITYLSQLLNVNKLVYFCSEYRKCIIIKSTSDNFFLSVKW